MAKLSDTAATILTTAASRDNRRILPLPKLKAPAVVVRKTLGKMIADGLVEEVPASRDDEVWEHSESEGNTTLVITSAGLGAIGIEDEAPVSYGRGRKRAKTPTRGRRASGGAKTASKTPRVRTAGIGGKRESKQDTVIALLRRANGATIEEMQKSTGWLPHSVRGFLSGALKKRLKLTVVSEKDAKTNERRYHITTGKPH